MTSHSRLRRGKNRLFPVLLLLLLFAGAGCAAHRSESGAREETPSSFINSFMEKAVADNYEEAFDDLDMEALVNYGHRVSEVYEALPPPMQERFRRDLIEGIYARLFRNLPRDDVTYRIAAVEGDPFTVEVSASSPRKNLFFTVKPQKGEMKIVQIEKTFTLALVEPAPVQSVLDGVLEVCPGTCDFGRIQDAIDAASEGNTILVHDGTYEEHIDFRGKAIAVKSINGPRHTRIQGLAQPDDHQASVVTFSSGEGPQSVLDGFSISGGRGGLIHGIQSLQTTGMGTDIGTFGGGIHCTESSPTIRNCVISGNTASKGGGISCWKASPLIENCIISGNLGRSEGGAVYAGNSQPRLVATTVSGNAAGQTGGAFMCYWASPVVLGSIVWGNMASGKEDNLRTCGRMARIERSDIGDGAAIWPDGGNILADPLFRERIPAENAPTVEGDYRLTAKSPCIDRIGPTELPSKDIDGNLRPAGGGSDMGAVEFIPDESR